MDTFSDSSTGILSVITGFHEDELPDCVGMGVKTGGGYIP